MDTPQADAHLRNISQESLEGLLSPETYLAPVTNHMMIDPSNESHRLRTFSPFPAEKIIRFRKLSRNGCCYEAASDSVKCYSCYARHESSLLLDDLGTRFSHEVGCPHVDGTDEKNVPILPNYNQEFEKIHAWCESLVPNQEDPPDTEERGGNLTSEGESADLQDPEDDKNGVAQAPDSGMLKRDNVETSLENENRADNVQPEPRPDSVLSPRKKKKTSEDAEVQEPTDAKKAATGVDN